MIKWQTIPEKYWVLADQMVVSGSGFVTSLLLARGLGVLEFGRFSGLAMIQLFLLSVTMALTSQVYQEVQPALSAKQARLFTKGMLGQQLGIAALLLTAILLAYLFYDAFASLQANTTPSVILLWGLATILYLLQDFLRRVFITCNKAGLALVTDLADNALQLAGLCLAWYFNRLTPPVAWGIIAAAYLPAVITGLVLLKAGTPGVAAAGFAWQWQKSRSGWLLGSSLLQWGAGYFFVAAAGWYLGAAALGALRLAQYIFGLLNVLLQAIESYALPRAAAHAANPRAYWLFLVKKCLLFILPLLLLLSVFAKPVLTLAGGSVYAPYTYVMYGLSAVYVLMAIGYPVRIAIRWQQLHRHYFIAYLLSVAAGIAAAPWLLHHWQLYGVLAGLFLTQFICIGYWLIILQYKKSFLWKSFT